MRIIKYLLEHKAALAAVVVLLIGQAFCDLALPSLTSDIVDVGIQQSGVEHVATTELRATTYDTIADALTGSDKTLLEQSFDRTQAGTYKLNDYGSAHLADLDRAMQLPMAYIYVMQKAAETQGGEGGEGGATADASGFAAAGSPSPSLTSDSASAARSVEISESVAAQTAIQAALAEYKALGYDINSMQMSYLLKTGAAMLGLAALGMLIAIVVGFVASRTGAAIGATLRTRLFGRVVAFSDAEIGKFSAASLITRGTNDIQLVQNVSIMMMRMVLYAPILAIGGIIMVMTTDAQMGWVIVVAIVAVFIVIGILFKFAMPKFKIMQKLIDRVNLVAREMLSGMPVIRAYRRTQTEEARFDAASRKLMQTQLFTNRVMAFMMPTMMLIMNATSVAIVWVGGHYIDAGSIQTGDLIAFITYAMVIIMGFLMLGMISIMLPRADVAAARIDEVLQTEPSIKDAPDAVELSDTQIPLSSKQDNLGKVKVGTCADTDAPADACAAFAARAGLAAAASPSPPSPPGAKVEFCDVSFKYDDISECVLEHIDFAVQPGQSLGIIGACGCGKSTVLKLIERFYDTTAGAVKIDGVDVRKIKQASLRRCVAYVPQKAFLFSGTVASNVAYSDDDMPSVRIDEALQIAQAADFVSRLDKKEDSPISQGGTNVSGGQRQRLAIARAVAADARVILFDDSFSALDYKTDLALRSALDAQLRGITRIIAAQRIATIRNADCIIVLDDGRVVGAGTHDELIRSCEQYKDIALSQLSAEELGLEGGAK